MINIVCRVKSTGRICTDLADEITNQGHNVKIAYGLWGVARNIRELKNMMLG